MTHDRNRNRLELMNLTFGKDYMELKKGDYTDDRKVFVNMVDLLVDALREFDALDAKSPLIHIAFNDKFANEYDDLKELQNSLHERGMI